MTKRPDIILLCLAALVGCGGLETPDLQHGNVLGRVQGAVSGAFAYPLGSPQRKVSLHPDGTFELEALPVGAVTVVVFDGLDRAEAIPVEVSSAGRTLIERKAADMPLAGAVALTVSPDGGGLPTSPTYQLRETDQAGVITQGGGHLLFPVPSGTYQLDAQMAGYLGKGVPVVVSEGATVPADVLLGVGGDGPLGCAANADRCRNDLRCDHADGKCYQCLADADCPGSTCDPSGFCTASTGAAAPVCSVCSTDEQCGGVAAGAVCSSGYCTRGTSGPPPPSCPAGFELVTDGTASACKAPDGCSAYFEAFGASCYSDQYCTDRGIFEAVCRGWDAEHAGYCSAACVDDADCLAHGFTCDPVDRVCVRPLTQQ
jgi:hypothetical protein